MAELTELEKKRHELKAELRDHGHELLSYWLARTLYERFHTFRGRNSRNQRKPEKFTSGSYAWTLFLIFLVICALGLLISWFVHKELFSLHPLFGSFSIPQSLIAFLGSAGFILSIQIVTHNYLYDFFDNVREKILDVMQKGKDMEILGDWLRETFSVKNQLVAGILFSLGIHVIVLAMNSEFASRFGVVIIVCNILFNVLYGSIFFVYTKYLILNIVCMGYFDLKLYELDPRNSEIIYRLDSLMKRGVYITISSAVIITVCFYLDMELLSDTTSPQVFFFVSIFIWIAAVLHLAVNHITLGRLIRNAKWKTVNRLQLQIEQLFGKEHPPSQATIEHLNVLTAYHDKIMHTRNTALNLQDILTFVNTLIIPLLGFVLTELASVLEHLWTQLNTFITSLST